MKVNIKTHLFNYNEIIINILFIFNKNIHFWHFYDFKQLIKIQVIFKFETKKQELKKNKQKSY